jgi:hypothetical protein
MDATATGGQPSLQGPFDTSDGNDGPPRRQ